MPWPTPVTNDFSNMNAGAFPIHTAHYDGRDVDVKWAGNWFSNLTKASAEKLIALFTGPQGDQIDFVYVSVVSKCPTATPACELHEFWTTIRNSQLGLIPEDVAADAEALGANHPDALIRDRGKVRFRTRHEDHFHIRWIQNEP